MLGAVQADAGRVVTFGITPKSPETGYGYIRRGKALHHQPKRGRTTAQPNLGPRVISHSFECLNAGSKNWTMGATSRGQRTRQVCVCAKTVGI
jgi:hypothetical protein